MMSGDAKSFLGVFSHKELVERTADKRLRRSHAVEPLRGSSVL